MTIPFSDKLNINQYSFDRKKKLVSKASYSFEPPYREYYSNFYSILREPVVFRESTNLEEPVRFYITSPLSLLDDTSEPEKLHILSLLEEFSGEIINQNLLNSIRSKLLSNGFDDVFIYHDEILSRIMIRVSSDGIIRTINMINL